MSKVHLQKQTDSKLSAIFWVPDWKGVKHNKQQEGQLHRDIFRQWGT